MRIPHVPPKRILVPVDFSQTSFKAWSLARNLARLLGCELEAVFVFEVRSIPDRLAAQAPSLPLTQSLKTQLAYELRLALGQTARVSIVVDKPPVRGILDHAAERGCDLIVMGTHGRSGLARVMLGSVAEQVSLVSPVPVLTVHDQWEPIRSVLAPVSFSRYSLNGLFAAAELTRELEAHLDLLYVAKPGEAVPGAAFDAALDRLPGYFSRRRPRLLVREGDPAEQIVAAGVPYDLICLVSRRGSMVHDAFVGTTAERVLRASYTPVLSLPDTAREAVERLRGHARRARASA